MKKIFLFLLIIPVIMLWSCDGMYDKQAEFEGEIVYPARFDTVIGKIGFERVEIDLLKAGRIPASQIKLGKAKNTVVEYDDNVIVIDTLASYVNITGLTQTKLYRFKIFTTDEFGNKSVPQEIALIPFTNSDLESYAVSPPRIMASPSAAVVEWPGGISNVLLDYISHTYKYTDKDGVVRNGERGSDPRFFIGNLDAGTTVPVEMSYKIIPKINRERILDTITFNSVVNVQIPTASTPFSPAERQILEANGVSTFTAEGAAGITKIVYPVHTNSLQDIFYFPDLKVLDLADVDGLFNLPELVYDRNGVRDVVGGGAYEPFMRRVADLPVANYQALKDLLESEMLDKIYYRPNTMGIDDLLEPYIDAGVVELVEGADEILVGDRFQLDGIVQDANWTIDYTLNPSDAPAGDGLENVYKLVLKRKNASFVFALPREYQFNAKEYKYLRMKVYAPNSSYLQGGYDPYRCFWVRIMNRMWSFAQNSDYGQEYWDIYAPCLNDSQLEKWIDMPPMDLSGAVGKHNRVIILNIGKEPSIDFQQEITYYVSNIRFTKN